MKYVVDTSVILSGKDIPLTDEVYVPPSVLDEIKKGGRWYNKLKRLQAAGLKVVTPSGPCIEDVKKHSKKTGDFIRLSDTDVEVIALGLHLDAVILTDDYSIQNMARSMGISYRGMNMVEIKKEYRWGYRCAKCHRFYKEPADDCRICGGEIKTIRLTDD